MPVTDNGTLTTLQSVATTAGVGVAIEMEGIHRLTLHVTGSFAATVSFEGTIDDSNWFAVGLKTAADGAAVTSATAAGIWKLPNDGPCLSQFRANISAYTSGSVTAKARGEY